MRLALSLLLLAAARPGQAANTLQGRPIQVLSGDRILLLGDDGARYMVRLAGVTAPPADQRWGAAARRQLNTLVMGRSLTVYYQERRAGEELLGHLRHGGADVNIRLLQAGLAVFDPLGLSGRQAALYAEAERQSRLAGRGIWGEPSGKQPLHRNIPGGPLFRSSE